MKDFFQRLYSIPVIGFLGFDFSNFMIFLQIFIGILTVIKLLIDLRTKVKNIKQKK